MKDELLAQAAYALKALFAMTCKLSASMLTALHAAQPAGCPKTSFTQPTQVCETWKNRNG
ncbi:MAG: hypothetical protein KA752_04470 [Giesbergeria sp.]|nr:hypothetical protein [Giesbergeria sp.]